MIHNGEGILNYEQYPVGQHDGQIHSDAKGKRYYNPLLPQLSTVTVGGTATDGVYTIKVSSPGGKSHEVSFNRAAAETNEAITAALLADLQALGSLRNVAKVTANGTLAIDFEFLATDKVYTFELTAPAPGTLADANGQEAGGVDIKVARFVKQSAANSLHAVDLAPGDAETVIVGFAGRDYALLHNSEDPLADSEVYKKGSALSAIYSGTVSAKNMGAAATRGGAVFVVVNSAGGQDVGMARGDADGGNTVQLLAARAEWIEDVAAGAVGRIRLALGPGN